MSGNQGLRALIFDVDGTLAETEEVHRRAFNETFAAEGLGWHWDQATYGRLLKVTGGKERMRAWRDSIGSQAPDDATIARIHRQKTELYGQIVAEGGVAPRPGVSETVVLARSLGLRLAVATTTSRPNIDAMTWACWGCPAEEVFDVIAAGDEVPAKKPAPDVYLLALSRLGMSSAEALALEDSRNGLLSARAASLRVLVTPGLYTMHEDFSEADWLFPSLEDALAARRRGDDAGGFLGAPVTDPTAAHDSSEEGARL